MPLTCLLEIALARSTRRAQAAARHLITHETGTDAPLEQINVARPSTVSGNGERELSSDGSADYVLRPGKGCSA